MFYVAPLLLIALLLWIERGAPRPRALRRARRRRRRAPARLLPFERPDRRQRGLGHVRPAALVGRCTTGACRSTASGSPRSRRRSRPLRFGSLVPRAPRPSCPRSCSSSSLVTSSPSSSGSARASIGALFQGITRPRARLGRPRRRARREVAALWSGRRDHRDDLRERVLQPLRRARLHAGRARCPASSRGAARASTTRPGAARSGRPSRCARRTRSSTTRVPLAGRSSRATSARACASSRLGGAAAARRTRVEGVYDDGWSGPRRPTRATAARGGTLLVTVESDPKLFAAPQTVVGPRRRPRGRSDARSPQAAGADARASARARTATASSRSRSRRPRSRAAATRGGSARTSARSSTAREDRRGTCRRSRTPRTGVGNYLRGSLAGLAEAAGGRARDRRLRADEPARPARDPARRSTASRSSEARLPAVRARTGGRRGAASAARALERFLGRFDVLHFTDWMYPPQVGGVRSTMIHDLVPLRFPEWTTRARARCTAEVPQRRAHLRRRLRQLALHGRRGAWSCSAWRTSACAWRRRASTRVFRPDGERADLGRPYVLTVATLEPRKNLGTLVAAHRLLGERARARRRGRRGLGRAARPGAPGVVPLGLRRRRAARARSTAARPCSSTRRGSRASGCPSSRRWRAACRSSRRRTRRSTRRAATRPCAPIRTARRRSRRRSSGRWRSATSSCGAGSSTRAASRGSAPAGCSSTGFAAARGAMTRAAASTSRRSRITRAGTARYVRGLLGELERRADVELVRLVVRRAGARGRARPRHGLVPRSPAAAGARAARRAPLHDLPRAAPLARARRRHRARPRGRCATRSCSRRGRGSTRARRCCPVVRAAAARDRRLGVHDAGGRRARRRAGGARARRAERDRRTPSTPDGPRPRRATTCSRSARSSRARTCRGSSRRRGGSGVELRVVGARGWGGVEVGRRRRPLARRRPDEELAALYRGARCLRLPVALRGLRPAGARGDALRRAGRDERRDGDGGGRRRRRRARRPARRRLDRRRDRASSAPRRARRRPSDGRTLAPRGDAASTSWRASPSAGDVDRAPHGRTGQGGEGGRAT